MAKEFNKNLFKNASSCSDCKGTLSGQQLPGWIQGTVLYNGSVGIFDLKDMSVNHWFDGLSVMSLFKIQERGKVISFTKKFLKSDSYNDAMEQGKVVRAEFGTPGVVDSFHHSHPRKEAKSSSLMMHRSASAENFTPGDATDNCACSFYQFGNLTMATTETAFDRIIDSDSLETGDLIDMSNIVNIKTGRPLRDHNGDLYNLAASFVAGLKYHFIKFPKPTDGIHYTRDNFPNDVKFVATVPSRFPQHLAYVHTFGMTDNFLIFCEQPYASNISKLINCKNQGKSFMECLEWMPGEKNRFYVVDKTNGRTIEIKYMSTIPFYFLNFINCYESGSHIIIDILAYESPELISAMFLEKLRSGNGFTLGESSSKVLRFVLPLDFQEEGVDLNAGKWKDATAVRDHDVIQLQPRTITSEHGMEHPKLNPNFTFRKYNFVYVVGWMHGLDPENFYSNAITKIDVETGKALSWKTGDDCAHPSEVVFVPNPAGTSEDDGVLISCVSNSREENKSYIVFVNPRTMTEISRSHFDQPIPFGSHTYYIQK